MPRRDNAKSNAQYLSRLQEEFEDFSKIAVKDIFMEKGMNYQEAKIFLLKMRSRENKENNSSKFARSSAEINGIDEGILKSFLRHNNFAEIEMYIQKLSQDEIEKVLKIEFKDIKEVKKVFSGRSEYSARDEWIEHLHKIHDGNFRKTGTALAEDKILRAVIKQLYHIRFTEDEKDLLKNNFRLIDHLVQKRNVPLDRIRHLKPDQLVFELHWFSIGGAKDFVREVLKRTSGPELQLVTGIGLHSESRESRIKKMLVDVYGDRIREFNGNPGKMILTVPRGPSTHYRFSF
ncbi:unnamed protein product [Caenorhabditis brenneri]